MVRLTLMPSISAASRSEATARIDLPSVVRFTSWRSPSIITTLTTMMRISTESMLTPLMWMPFVAEMKLVVE
jgi:hypothetical protein